LPRRLSVDVVEWNTVYDSSCRESLKQVVLWRYREWNETWTYHVVAWRMADKCFGPERLHGKWVLWFDGQLVTAKMQIETHSFYDPEVFDRNRLPTSERK